MLLSFVDFKDRDWQYLIMLYHNSAKIFITIKHNRNISLIQNQSHIISKISPKFSFKTITSLFILFVGKIRQFVFVPHHCLHRK